MVRVRVRVRVDRAEAAVAASVTPPGGAISGARAEQPT